VTLWRILADPQVNESDTHVGVLAVSPESALKDERGEKVLDDNGKPKYAEGIRVEISCFKPRDANRSTWFYDSTKKLQKGKTYAMEGTLEDASYYVGGDGKFVDTKKMPPAVIRDKEKAGDLKKVFKLRFRPGMIHGVLERLDDNGGGSSTSRATATETEDTPDELPNFLRGKDD
jgi:hypothetical protein